MAPKPTYEELEKENLRLKASVDELRTYQEKYRAIFNHGFNCVYIHDLEGNFLEANDAALKLLGYEREEIFDINFASLIGEDQLLKAFETLEERRQMEAALEESERNYRQLVQSANSIMSRFLRRWNSSAPLKSVCKLT